MSEPRNDNRSRIPVIIGIVFLVAILGVAVFFAIQAFNTLPDYQRETQATPTPTPAYGSAMAVTRDPNVPTPAPELKRGSVSERVKELQTRLNALGYYTGTIDGQFYEGTENAVKAFQAANGLTADGIVGDQTEARLWSDDAVPASEAPATPTPTPLVANASVPTLSGVLRNGSSGDEVVTLQKQLISLGYLLSSADGKFGPATLNAVKAFQQVNGLTADGEVGQMTWTALFSGNALPKPTPIPLQDLDTSIARPYVRADGLPLVVNKKNPLPDGYQTLQLVNMNTYCDTMIVTIKHGDTLAEREAVDALMVMLQAAHADGITSWQISAAYRTVEYQQQLMNDKVSELMRKNGLSQEKAKQAARNTVADPGCSEHHLGTCFDITVPNTDQFKGTSQHRWLLDNCWDYGFILRYPEDKQSITGITPEAWHYRWVGLPHSTIMRDENLCLEEYVQRYGTPQ
ncbi:MAG: peptidoglycan-binding protein [Clostridia bacterium]|nr:peptidoglycan-binding protein [Clostridia bacterium]